VDNVARAPQCSVVVFGRRLARELRREEDEPHKREAEAKKAHLYVLM